MSDQSKSQTTIEEKAVSEEQSARQRTTIWRGQCRVCDNWFEHPKHTPDNPSPSGTFCPVCRDERRMTAPGVVHWKAEARAEHEIVSRLKPALDVAVEENNRLKEWLRFWIGKSQADEIIAATDYPPPGDSE